MMVSWLSLSLLFLTVTSIVSDETQYLKVGIYNEIPDLGGDSLASYKRQIERFITTPMLRVDAVVDKAQYNPYGDLETYLTQDGFDMLEIDTTSLQDLVANDLIVPMTDITTNIFPSAIEASKINGTLYAYPTLLHANFLIILTPGTEQNCPLRHTRNSYTDFHNAITQCQESLLSQYPTYDRILGGLMLNISNYYIDGYIDKHGAGTARQAVDEVLDKIIDEDICDRIEWYVDMCTGRDGNRPRNKCFHDFVGSYMRDINNLYLDIRNAKTTFYFGYSENLPRILKENPNIEASVALSAPLDSPSRVLHCTDGVVIGKKAWEEASEEKKDAMIDFINSFTYLDLRTLIALGADVDVGGRMRYLIQANRDVYGDWSIVNDPINMDLLWAADTGVALPVITDEERRIIHRELSRKCYPFDVPPPRADPKHIRAGKVDLRKGRHPSGAKKGPSPTPPCSTKAKAPKAKRDSRRGARRDL